MRKLISIEDMAHQINSTMDIRDKEIITVLAKTGIRRKELIALDVSDLDFVEQKIKPKPAAKRINSTVFFACGDNYKSFFSSTRAIEF